MDLIGSLRVPRCYLLGAVLATAVGLLLTGYVYLEHVTAGRPASPLGPLIEELGAAWATALAVPAIVALARRFPLDRRGWAPRLPAHLLGAMGYGVYHTSAMWVTRATLYPLAGLGSYDYGRMPLRYAMEFPNQLIVFSIAVLLTYLYDRHRAAQERELSISRLETELVRARLEALRMQLNPHFLFNTLNTISSVMYEDVETADDMLSRLSILLRRSIEGGESQEVPIRDELEALELYLDIMRARFGEQLSVRIDMAPEALEALVPSMVLQPLVENAIEHGRDPAGGPLAVKVAGSVAGALLCLEVWDSGRGDVGGELRCGIGLGNTAERLGKLYGDGHRIETGSGGGDGSGFRVRVKIPFRSAAEAGPPPMHALVKPE